MVAKRGFFLQEKAMTKFFGGAVLCVCVVLSVVVALGQAEPAGRPGPAAVSRYDADKEVVIEGTVSSLVKRPGRGLLAGAHVMLNTAFGPLDAHLGNYAMRGRGALSLSRGDQVKVTGVRTTVDGRDVFLVRTVRKGLSVCQVRNARGFLLRPAPSASAGRMKTIRRDVP
jgi:hypothetical protein